MVDFLTGLVWSVVIIGILLLYFISMRLHLHRRMLETQRFLASMDLPTMTIEEFIGDPPVEIELVQPRVPFVKWLFRHCLIHKMRCMHCGVPLAYYASSRHASRKSCMSSETGFHYWVHDLTYVWWTFVCCFNTRTHDEVLLRQRQVALER